MSYSRSSLICYDLNLQLKTFIILVAVATAVYMVVTVIYSHEWIFCIGYCSQSCLFCYRCKLRLCPCSKLIEYLTFNLKIDCKNLATSTRKRKLRKGKGYACKFMTAFGTVVTAVCFVQLLVTQW